ncbi:MAG: hypothetical protein JSV38_08540 [Desulfobacterales bacterium]|nr:MAG: hypothetical protein JSV38_08540 [Desulfobacterales bacterium]
MIQIQKQQEPGWVEHLKTHCLGAERFCRHVLTGRIDAPKICPLSYECFHCGFDQMMDEYNLTSSGYN